MDWTNELDKQLSWHWENQLRPRLAGLTDEEYFWEPVPGMWSVRSGRIDFAYPEPIPAPVTTIAWRIGHLLVGVFGDRIARHFGGPRGQLRHLRLPVNGRRCPCPAGRHVRAVDRRRPVAG